MLYPPPSRKRSVVSVMHHFSVVGRSRSKDLLIGRLTILVVLFSQGADGAAVGAVRHGGCEGVYGEGAAGARGRSAAQPTAHHPHYPRHQRSREGERDQERGRDR